MEYLKTLKEDVEGYDAARQQLIKDSSDILRASKKAVFALHRDNASQAMAEMQIARKLITSIESQAKETPRLAHEGSFNAALEEFVEARLMYTYIKEGRLDDLSDITSVNANHYIGGLCDFTGELTRQSTLLVIKGNYEPIQAYYDLITEIMAELLEFNLTGYLRKKSDEMKRNVRNLERILYDISLK